MEVVSRWQVCEDRRAPIAQTELLWNYFHARQQQSSKVTQLRNQIARQNIRLVQKVAHRFARQCPEPYEDLEQIGQLGLIKAIEKFQPDRNVAFSSFAVPYIEGAIRHHLRDHWGSVKVPRRAVELHSKVRRLQRRLKDLGREMTEVQVAANLGVSREKWQWTKEALERKPLLDLDDLSEAIAAPEIEISEGYSGIYQFLGNLPNPYRACLIAHYYGQQSLEAIATAQNCSVDDIDKLLVDALFWLRCQLEGNRE